MNKVTNNILNKKLVAVGTMLMVSSWAMAQHTITGKVTDGTTGEEIIGASVTEVDATGRVISAAVTNINGEYSLVIKNPKNKISVSYIGYKNQKITLKGQTTLDIKLQDSSIGVNEVTVTARRRASGESGFNISQREVSQAVGHFNLSDIEGVSVTSADDALQGRISGLDIVGSGVPGSGS